jgi:DeoR/GlpR family transcriptional regulator of sugar metabolism
MIRRLRFDIAFVTSACISAHFGLSIQLGFWPGIINAVIDSSKKTVGLYPTEKIGFESVRMICPADRLDTLITDWDAPEEELRLLDESGIEVRYRRGRGLSRLNSAPRRLFDIEYPL